MIAVPLPSGSLAVGGPSGFGVPSSVAVNDVIFGAGVVVGAAVGVL
jgi:hypothetical protein